MIAGALGHRQALFGYAGHLPEKLAPGDTIHLLNMGGVLGIFDGGSPDLGLPFECEVLGAVLRTRGFKAEEAAIRARTNRLIDRGVLQVVGGEGAVAGGEHVKLGGLHLDPKAAVAEKLGGEVGAFVVEGVGGVDVADMGADFCFCLLDKIRNRAVARVRCGRRLEQLRLRQEL